MIAPAGQVAGAVGEPRLRTGDPPERALGEVEDLDVGHHVLHLVMMRAGVHPDRSAERGRDRDAELQSR